ncbi:uncharacterized protein PAC_17260 [Phialocephala subalpina]|uniref:Uncharacterized protein n=1 Tax=Phialocephala subalpina TaxID=576137 RepID=A0A1L7XQN0_9HELO|nr:uncharacterized protein PAC_17260 [Phialocephala subalpina]
MEDPIIIDDDESPPETAAALPHKKQRASKRDEEVETLHQKSPKCVDSFIQVKELLRSSGKIVVISGAGIAANAGFPTFQDMRKSKQTRFDRFLYSVDETIDFYSTACTMFEHLHLDSC